MILWVNDSAEGLWLNATSLGDAGASCFGYYGGCFSRDGLQVMAHGFTGALHLWKWQQQQQQQAVGASPASAAAAAGAEASEAADLNNAAGQASTAAAAALGNSSSSGGGWQPVHAQGGHFGAVADLSWGADGACLQTVSTDQTARMWTAVGGHWCEMARTQVRRVTLVGGSVSFRITALCSVCNQGDMMCMPHAVIACRLLHGYAIILWMADAVV
jgi:elongator complex protein 2